MTRTLKEKLAAAKLPERVVTLCLRGDLLARHAELVSELAQVRATDSDSLGGADDEPLVAELEALRAEMEEDAIELRLRAMPLRRWDELIREYPAKSDSDMDRRAGFDVVGFYRAAIAESTIEPAMDESDWATLLGDDDHDGLITQGQWADLTQAVLELNQRPVSVPFLPSGWLRTTSSGSG